MIRSCPARKADTRNTPTGESNASHSRRVIRTMRRTLSANKRSSQKAQKAQKLLCFLCLFVAIPFLAAPRACDFPNMTTTVVDGVCRVAATLRPAPDSEIKIEVWMPESGWNGKLQSVGNGAWAGTISYPAMTSAVKAGYAAASTDTGHTGNNPAFIPGHPEKVIDFGYRAVHEMTVAAKSIIKTYYGNGPKLSYWNGCSTGGRQALTEARRYPNDYDGILAGAPAINASHLQGAQVWSAQAVHKDEASYIPPAKYSAIHNAVLRQCDALDGVKDGVLENPTQCKFDPKVLLCKEGDAPSCLTAPQVEAARRLYEGPRNVFPGLEPGSELGWSMLSGPKPMSLAAELYKYLVL